MKTDIQNNDLLRRFLLDGATEDERREVEERFMSDDAAFNAINAVEDELFFEYQQNELTSREREIFVQKFLRTPEDRARAAFAGTFLEATKELAGKQKAVIAEEKISFWGRLRLGPAVQLGLAAAVILLCAAMTVLVIQNRNISDQLADFRVNSARRNDEREAVLTEKENEKKNIEQQLTAEREKGSESDKKIKELEDERARLEREIGHGRRQTATPPADRSSGRGTIAALVLSPGIFTRGDGKPMPRVDLKPPVETLLLGLTLKDSEDYKSFSVTVDSIDTGHTIWSRSNLKANKGKLHLNIPAEVLMRTDYEITLTGTTNAGELEEITRYYFSVNK